MASPWRTPVAGCIAAFAALLPARGGAELPAYSWKSQTESPRAGSADANVATFQKLCGTFDGALLDVAKRAAAHQAESSKLLASDEVAFALRAAGDPHPWARAWSISGKQLDDAEVSKKVQALVAGWTTLGTKRCAFARAEKNGEKIVAAAMFDALADMKPLPVTARASQWLTLEGNMLVPASAVKVVLLGPRGAPKSVTASLSGSKIRSTFSLDQPGAWLVQVLATVSTGPRPVLETFVHVGTQPPTKYVRTAAPGEEAKDKAKDDVEALYKMVNAARAAEGLSALTRDADLEKLAKKHSDEMVKAGQIGHDVGGGDPGDRVKAAGLKLKIAGENVANAADVVGAHRALWASPSHRGNLLLKDFSKIGLAVVKSSDGRVWVTQLFGG